MRVAAWSHEHEIVVNPDSFNLAWICAVWVRRRLAAIIMLQRVETSIYVGEKVVFNRNVIHHGNVATLAGADGEQNRIANLRAYPGIFKDIARNHDSTRTLELQIVLLYPLIPHPGRTAYPVGL